MDILDLNQINDLLSLEKISNSKIIHELLTIYKKQLSEFKTETNLALEKNDLDHLSQLAHKLKSSAGNLGLIVPRNICFYLENEANKKSNLNYHDLINKISLESQISIKTLEEYLAVT